MAVVCTAKLIWMGSLNEVDLGGLDDNLKTASNLFQMVDFNFFCHRIRQIQPSNNLSNPLPSNQLFEYIYIYILCPVCFQFQLTRYVQFQLTRHYALLSNRFS